MARIAITNMTCGGCTKGVAATLREVLPGQEPRFDLERREVTVEGNPDLLVAALRAAGWDAHAATGQ